jgi:hypothetical protein
MIERDAALGPRTTLTPKDSQPSRPSMRETLARWIGGKPALQRVP